MNICVYGAASDRIGDNYKKAGVALGESIALSGNTLVFGGGASGMMGAVARGTYSKNGKLIGITPSFFNVDGALFQNCTELIYTETMRERKQLLEDKSDAFLITPGGIGTFDEFFETLTLRQLCAHLKPIAIYNIDGYYDPIIDMLESAMAKGFVGPENRTLYFFSDNPDAIMDYFNNYNPEDTEPSKFRNAK